MNVLFALSTAAPGLVAVQDGATAETVTTVARGGGLTEVTVLFALTFTLALVVERMLEISKTALDIWDSRPARLTWWNNVAKAQAGFISRRLQSLGFVDPRATAAMLAKFNQMLLSPQCNSTDDIPILTTDAVRSAWVKLALKVAGAVLGIGLVYGFRIDLFYLWMHPTDSTPGFDPGYAWMTGILIGLGAGPVHKIITSLEQRREKKLAAQPGEG